MNSLICQSIKNNTDCLITKTKVEFDNKTYFVYEKDETCLFTIVNESTKKEDILHVCMIAIYQKYLETKINDKHLISLEKASENTSNPQNFLDILNDDTAMLPLEKINFATNHPL